MVRVRNRKLKTWKGKKMYEIGEYLNQSHTYPAAIQKNNCPIYKGKPNPVHGKFYFAGTIPGDCYDFDKKHSKYYETEEAAITAAIAAGAQRIQRNDCSFVVIPV